MKTNTLMIVLLTLLIGCSSPETVHENGRGPIHVTSQIIAREKVTTVLRYSGAIEAFSTVPLTFQTAGTVEKVLTDAGEMVKKGQLLATLDKTDAQNMLDISTSQYQQAKDAYDRLKIVHEKGSLPDIKWVEMETKLEQARSSLNLAKNNLDKCSMVAPVGGMIGRRNIEPGMSSISITAAPLELVEIGQVYLKISVPENEIALISKGLSTSFTVQALDNREFMGTVAVVTPVADLISRTYEVKILVNNQNIALKPGMVCDVRLDQTAERELIMVPAQSVTRDFGNKAYVFVVDTASQTAFRREVTTGQFMESGLEILSGLQPGERIVTEGKEKLSDHAKIVF
jgi:RND family efflux transporter MFP subunit